MEDAHNSSSSSGSGSSVAAFAKCSRISLETFIALVKTHRFLFDKHCPEFKDIALKEKTWNAIGIEVGLTGEQCMIKWKGLRDRYVRIKKENDQKKRENPSAVQWKCSWKLYDAIDGVFASSPETYENILATKEMCKDEMILPNNYEVISIKSEISQDPELIATHAWNETAPPMPEDMSSTTMQERRKRKSTVMYLFGEDQETPAKKPVHSDAKSIMDLMKTSLFEDEVVHFAMNIALRLRKLKRWPMLKAMNSIENSLFAVEAEEAD